MDILMEAVRAKLRVSVSTDYTPGDKVLVFEGELGTELIAMFNAKELIQVRTPFGIKAGLFYHVVERLTSRRWYTVGCMLMD